MMYLAGAVHTACVFPWHFLVVANTLCLPLCLCAQVFCWYQTISVIFIGYNHHQRGDSNLDTM